MNKPKHTPGPWKVEYHTEKTGPYKSLQCQIWNQNTHICDMNEHLENVEIDKANARLIAAAPELLAALEHGIAECMRAYKLTAKLEMQNHKYGAALNELVLRLNEVLKSARTKATGGAK